MHTTIKGVTMDGSKFRPSNWADRLQCFDSIFDVNYGIPKQLHNVWVCHSDKCVLLKINHTLANDNPYLFDHLIGFANMHNLVVIDLPPRYIR